MPNSNISFKPIKKTALSLQISSAAMDLIELASQVSGKCSSDFIVDAAQKEALALLLDRRHFITDPSSST